MWTRSWENPELLNCLIRLWAIQCTYGKPKSDWDIVSITSEMWLWNLWEPSAYAQKPMHEGINNEDGITQVWTPWIKHVPSRDSIPKTCDGYGGLSNLRPIYLRKWLEAGWAYFITSPPLKCVCPSPGVNPQVRFNSAGVSLTGKVGKRTLDILEN